MSRASALPPEPLEQHTFTCAVCGAQAALVYVYGPPAAARLVRTCCSSRLTAQVVPERFGALYRAVAAGDAPALYRIDGEYAAFYCPECDACYCGKHWRLEFEFEDAAWLDRVTGECPSGHKRMLED
jgi:hypothetical protein